MLSSGLNETSKFQSFLLFEKLRILFVKSGKGLKCECRIGSFAKLGSLSNLNFTTPLYLTEIYLIYSTLVQEQNAIVG